MVDFQYQRAPITEAVVEFKFANLIADRKRERVIKRLAKSYAAHKSAVHRSYEVKVEPTGSAKLTHTESPVNRFNSSDMTEQLHVGEQSFLVTQLAPYGGWEKFRDRVKRDWDTLEATAGFQSVEQVGMRYINRIDLPVEDSLVHFENYLEVYPLVPEMLKPYLFHSMNVRVPLQDIGAELNLKSAVVESPLPEHMAILLDLDIVRVFQDSPSKEALFSFIEQARTRKNEVFEACITSKARGLFN